MATKKSNQVKRLRPAGGVVPLADRVAKSRAALEKRGGVKLPTGWLQPEPAHAMEYLLSHGYATTRIGCIAKALFDTAEALRNRTSKHHKKP